MQCTQVLPDAFMKCVYFCRVYACNKCGVYKQSWVQQLFRTACVDVIVHVQCMKDTP